MIPVINAARQENSRRSVRIADMLSPFMPPQNKAWHPNASTATGKQLRRIGSVTVLNYMRRNAVVGC